MFKYNWTIVCGLTFNELQPAHGCLQFIYISVEEMEAVASFITRRGRIAIGELAAKSDELIDLEQKEVALLPGALPGLEFADLDVPAGPVEVEAAA